MVGSLLPFAALWTAAGVGRVLKRCSRAVRFEVKMVEGGGGRRGEELTLEGEDATADVGVDGLGVATTKAFDEVERFKSMREAPYLAIR